MQVRICESNDSINDKRRTRTRRPMLTPLTVSTPGDTTGLEFTETDTYPRKTQLAAVWRDDNGEREFNEERRLMKPQSLKGNYHSLLRIVSH